MTTILFAEDQLELRAIHTAYLQKHGYKVITTDDGASVMALARKHRPDLVVLDHSLPGRTGTELAGDMRRDPKLAGVPIVMMTAHAYGAIGMKAQAAGCNAFLSKPCTPSRLLLELRRYDAAAPQA